MRIIRLALKTIALVLGLGAFPAVILAINMIDSFIALCVFIGVVIVLGYTVDNV